MLNAVLKEYASKLESRLDILLHEGGQLYDGVLQAARYSLLDGGKRIRPVILLEFYKLCGGTDDCAYNFAAALEMIHTYSLIHDDLPCMDDDDMRRGKPACHIKFDEATALLAGDTLLTESFGVAAKTLGLPNDRIVRALSILSSAAGVAGMIGGQVIDLANENGQPSAETLLETYRLKTGALLRCAAAIGATLAGVDESLVAEAEAYGENLGLAFQMIDDILDAEGDAQLLGKPVGSDEKNGKQTLVTLYGLERCREMAAEYTKKALDALKCFSGDTTVLEQLTDYLLTRNR